jgi:hypothetical protein
VSYLANRLFESREIALEKQPYSIYLYAKVFVSNPIAQARYLPPGKDSISVLDWLGKLADCFTEDF